MPLYKYKSEDGEEIEKFLLISEMTDEISENGKTFYRVNEFGTNFKLKGNGWTTNGSADFPSPKKSKAELGLKVDQEKKAEMEMDQRRKKK